MGFTLVSLLILCVIKILGQSRTLSRYRESIKLFKESTAGFEKAIDKYDQAVDRYEEIITEYQQAVEVFIQSTNEYEFVLKKHGIDESKSPARLQAYLLVLLDGDFIVSKKLLEQQRQTHPGQADNWYLEKVIYDLERDQRWLKLKNQKKLIKN